MTKKNIGLAKDKVVRIHKDDLTELNSIRTELKLSSKNNKPGDVVHNLIMLYRGKKIDGVPSFSPGTPIDSQIQTKIDEYNSLLEDRTAEVIRWKKRTEIACEKANVDVREIIELVQ